MNTDARVVRYTPDGREEFGVEEFVEHGGSAATVSLLAKDQALLTTGELPDYVNHNSETVERAMEEEVFVAEVKFLGWLVNDDPDNPERWQKAHPGETVSGRFLVENYSDDAWRLIAEEAGGGLGTWYNYRWTFIPKSKSRLTRVVGVESREESDAVGSVAHETYREKMYDSWDKSLEEVDNEPEDVRRERELVEENAEN